jgi:hypothetical protein
VCVGSRGLNTAISSVDKYLKTPVRGPLTLERIFLPRKAHNNTISSANERFKILPHACKADPST